MKLLLCPIVKDLKVQGLNDNLVTSYWLMIWLATGEKENAWSTHECTLTTMSTHEHAAAPFLAVTHILQLIFELVFALINAPITI